MYNNDQPDSDGHWENQLNSSERQTFFDLFHSVDVGNKGITLKDEAMNFFNKTSIPPRTLSEIWDYADENSKGFLTAKEFCIALKLIACAQHGHTIVSPVLSTSVSMPCFDGASIEEPLDTAITPLPAPLTADTITPDERNSYIQIFYSAGPIHGILSGDKITSFFRQFNLPSSTLERIRNMADLRKSGSFSQAEFIIAMHYTSLAMNGVQSSSLPVTPPADIYAAATGQHPTTSRGNQITTTDDRSSEHEQLPSTTSDQQLFCLTKKDYEKCRLVFQQLVQCETGFVSGTDAARFFRSSKLPKMELANIWDLVDTTSRGDLSEQEFCVAMHLVEMRMAGIRIPNTFPLSISQLVPSSIERQQHTSISTRFDTSVTVDDARYPANKCPFLPSDSTATQQQHHTDDDIKQIGSKVENNLDTNQKRITTVEKALISSLTAEQHIMKATLDTLSSAIDKENQLLNELERTEHHLKQCLEMQYGIKDTFEESRHHHHHHHQQRSKIADMLSTLCSDVPDANNFSLSSTAPDHDLIATLADDDTDSSLYGSTTNTSPSEKQPLRQSPNHQLATSNDNISDAEL